MIRALGRRCLSLFLGVGHGREKATKHLCLFSTQNIEFPPPATASFSKLKAIDAFKAYSAACVREIPAFPAESVSNLHNTSFTPCGRSTYIKLTNLPSLARLLSSLHECPLMYYSPPIACRCARGTASALSSSESRYV